MESHFILSMFAAIPLLEMFLSDLAFEQLACA
jgi:hypothetical protein